MQTTLKLLSLFFFCAVNIAVSAQFVFPTQSARGAAMGGASVALDDFGSAASNIAGFAHQKYTVAVAIDQNYARRTFKSLCAVVYSSKRSTLAIDYSHYGNIDYNEQKTSLDYALAIGKKVNLGLAFHYLYSGTSDAYYLPVHLLTFSAGLQTRLSDHMLSGFQVFNTFGIRLNDDATSMIPILLNAGVSYKLMPNLLGTIEIEKNIYLTPCIRFGVEYDWNKKLFARAGFATQPIVYTFGVGLMQRHYAVNLAMQVHQVLGLAPQLSAYYRF